MSLLDAALQPSPTVYIVAIAWLYVTLLMAATEPSVVGGVLTFLAYGAGPLAIFLYVFGRRRPRSSDDPRARALGRAHAPCASRPISQIVATPRPISSTCCAVAPSAGRRCRLGMRSATAT
jgi:hypothetical protein